MNVKICICDDSSEERAAINALVRQWSRRSGTDVSVSEFPTAEAFLFEYEDLTPDIVLLDIEMPGMNGVELAKRLRKGNKLIQIVFITGFSEYIAEGYEVAADAHIPALLNFSAVDLCTILGNLFDNAIEASVSLPPERRVIRVYMDMKDVQLYISFLNFTNGGKLKKVGNIFRSSKGSDHGLGLERIESVVKKLGGYLSVNSEDGAFTTEILLPEALN